MTLQQIWTELKEQGHETDKGSVHSYIPVYEKLLAPYRETALNVLEIGCFKGDSLRMWSAYFTKAHVHGIDCSLTPHGGLADLKPLVDDILNSEPYSKLFTTHVHIFDAENKEEVAKRFSGIKFDVIIEDAGHEINQQLNLYDIWRNYLSEGGVYIIEDVQDIKASGRIFLGMEQFYDNIKVEIIDRRKIKNRYDDCMIIIQ